MEDLKVCVLMRFNKKSGNCDTVMTGLGSALLTCWGMQNTTPSKVTFVFERESGKILTAIQGNKSGLPKVKNVKRDGDLGICEDIGITLEELHEIKDDRFDE